MGFPDDGYDYNKHMRVLGKGRAAMESQPTEAAAGGSSRGPGAEAGSAAGASSSSVPSSSSARQDPSVVGGGHSVFIPAMRATAPEADVKLVDARNVAVLGTSTVDDDEIKEAVGGPSLPTNARRVQASGQ